MTKEHFDGVELIRIRFMDRLTGPFTRLMIRPMPEVALLDQGSCNAIIRGHRINQIVLIMGGSRSCYYTEKNRVAGSQKAFGTRFGPRDMLGRPRMYALRWPDQLGMSNWKP